MANPVLSTTGSLMSGGGRAGSLAGNWKVPFDLGFGNSEASVQQIWAGPRGQGWGAVGCSHGGDRSQHDGMICAESDREQPPPHTHPCPWQSRFVCITF